MKISLVLAEECKHVVTLDFTFESKHGQDSATNGEYSATTAAATSVVRETVTLKW